MNSEFKTCDPRFPAGKLRPVRICAAAGSAAISNRSAFSLIEIMIVMGLLSIMVLGLMAMFNQTQRAFRLGMMQTDVLESGRLATDMLVREIEQITPSYGRAFFAPPGFYSRLSDVRNTGVQTLLAGNYPRTNIMEDLFFLKRENQTWTGIGYFVRTNEAFFGGNAGFGPVGTLYRFETNNHLSQFQQNPDAFTKAYNDAVLGNNPNVSKVVDGVVHFRIRAYDTNGVWITPPSWNGPAVYMYRTNIQANPSALFSEVGLYDFESNAVPAYVEIELGVLEQQTYEKYKSIPTFNTRSNYLVNQAAHVHLFRQRIAVRAVDASAYR